MTIYILLLIELNHDVVALESGKGAIDPMVNPINLSAADNVIVIIDSYSCVST